MDSKIFIPYAELDGFGDLAFSEALLVWAVRVWVGIANPETGPGGRLAIARLQAALGRAGAPDAALQLDALWSIIGLTARRQIDIRCTGSIAISRDEVLFVREIACRQRLVTPGPAGLLAGLCPSAARRQAAPLAQALATSFDLARLHLPVRADGALLDRSGLLERAELPSTDQDLPGALPPGQVVTLH